jgi:hypothetical protein
MSLAKKSYFGIIGIHANDRVAVDLGQIAAFLARPSPLLVRRVANLVVDNKVNGAAHVIVRHLGKRESTPLQRPATHT